jgi:glycosyltransferase involved in cell wall biosynthesis
MVRELGIGGCEMILRRSPGPSIDGGLRRMSAPCIQLAFDESARRRRHSGRFTSPITSLASRSWFSGARVLGNTSELTAFAWCTRSTLPWTSSLVPIARYYRVPIIIKSHLGYRDAYAQRFRGLFSVTDRMAKAFVVNSRAVQQDLVAHGVPLSRTHLCYNGVDTSTFHPGESSELEPSAARPLVIGTVCALRAEKRLDWLLEAFARIRERVPHVRLLVVGSGPMRDNLEEQRKRLNLMDVSDFEPTTSEVAQWMRRMDVFVLTSETEASRTRSSRPCRVAGV